MNQTAISFCCCYCHIFSYGFFQAQLSFSISSYFFDGNSFFRQPVIHHCMCNGTQMCHSLRHVEPHGTKVRGHQGRTQHRTSHPDTCLWRRVKDCCFDLVLNPLWACHRVIGFHLFLCLEEFMTIGLSPMDERLALSYSLLLDGVIFLAMNQKIRHYCRRRRGEHEKKERKMASVGFFFILPQ